MVGGWNKRSTWRVGRAETGPWESRKIQNPPSQASLRLFSLLLPYSTDSSLPSLSFNYTHSKMVGIFSRFSVSRAAHRRTQSALVSPCSFYPLLKTIAVDFNFPFSFLGLTFSFLVLDFMRQVRFSLGLRSDPSIL